MNQSTGIFQITYPFSRSHASMQVSPMIAFLHFAHCRGPGPQQPISAHSGSQVLFSATRGFFLVWGGKEGKIVRMCAKQYLELTKPTE